MGNWNKTGDRMKEIIILIVGFLFSKSAFSEIDSVHLNSELKVGNKVHIAQNFPVLNASAAEINISDTKKKIIVLEFFDTYCATCIADMPKLKDIQQQFEGQLEIILVTWQDEKTIRKFFETNKFLKEKEVYLPTIYADTVLRRYFPHLGVPHSVWIYQNRVAAVTYRDFVTLDNLQTLWRDSEIRLPIKDDFKSTDPMSGPKATDEDQVKSIGKVNITGYNPALKQLGSVNSITDSVRGSSITYFNNLDVFGAYTAVWSKIKKPTFYMKPERIIWEVKDPTRYIFTGQSEENMLWLMQNAICYYREDIFKRDEKELAGIILDDLNTFLGLNVYWDVRETRCLVIRKKDSMKQVQQNKDADQGQKIKGSSVLVFLMDYSNRFLPVVDEANYSDTMIIPRFDTVEKLNSILEKYGLEVVEENKKLEVLIFQEMVQ